MVDHAHQLPCCIAEDVRAFVLQVLSQHRLDLEVSSTEIVATGTFELNFQIAEVRVLALAHACFSDPNDVFTALAFELQLRHFPAELSVQRLYLVSRHLSTVGAILILRIAVKGDLFL